MADIKFARLVLFVNAAVPLALLGWDAYHHRLGANPLEFFTHITGTLTLVFLLLTVALTPLRKLLGIPWLVKLRRMLGLYAFFYGFLHLTAYMWFDKSFELGAVVEDVLKRRFILVGMFSFLLMVPLAITSTKGMVRRLGGKRWNRLHKLVYVAAGGGVLHYFMLVKADTRIPLGFGVALALLLLARVLVRYLPWSATQRRPRVAESSK
jgi:sulfoxide reductase heme-binding subunit YedZ